MARRLVAQEDDLHLAKDRYGERRFVLFEPVGLVVVQSQRSLARVIVGRALHSAAHLTDSIGTFPARAIVNNSRVVLQKLMRSCVAKHH